MRFADSATRRRLLAIGGLATGVAVLAVFIGRGFLVHEERRASAPNILLVSIDTIRADRVGAYGWRRGRTPAIDRLAGEGVCFTKAYAAVPMTLPSHTTIMTGLYPFHHGVRDNSGFELNDQAKTLAEVLRSHGYQTGAVVAAFVLDSRFGLDQGFQEYRDTIPARSQFERFEVPERNAAHVADDALDWLQHLEADRPFFLWVHFYDPHHPYHTPQTFPFYLSHPYDLEIAFTDFHFQRILDHLRREPFSARPTLIVVVGDHGEGLGEYGEETHAYFAYDSTLHVPLVIKLPDGSHAGTKIEVPVSLVDVMPTVLDLAGLPVPEAGEIHGHSLAALLNGDAGEVAAFRQRPIYFESYSPFYSFGWAPVRGVRIDDAKYIESPQPELYLFSENDREGERNSVYPDQQSDIDRMVHAMEELLEASLRTPALSGRMQSADPEVIEKLRSLGYLSGPAAERSEWTRDDDLKSRLPLYNTILTATSELGAGDAATGMAHLLEVLRVDADNPRCLLLLGEAVAANPADAADAMPVIEEAAHNRELDVAIRAPLLTNCGRALLATKEAQRALTLFEEAAELEPENPTTLGWVSTAYLHLGRPDQAVVFAHRAAELAPDVVPLGVLAGVARFCAGQVQEGADAWNRLLAREDRPLSPWDLAATSVRDTTIAAMALEPYARAAADPTLPSSVRAALHAAIGQFLLNSGQCDGALAALRRASELLTSEHATGLWLQARALTCLNQTDEARQLLERAYRLDPDAIQIVADLAVLLHGGGETSRAVELLSSYYDAHSEDPTAANNLAWMLAERAGDDSDLERALALAKYAVQVRRGSAGFADTLGWVHLKRRDAESAVYSLARAARLDPSNAEHQYHLGLAYRLEGQPEQARQAFAAAVELAPTPRPDWFAEAVAGSSGADGGETSLPR